MGRNSKSKAIHAYQLLVAIKYVLSQAAKRFLKLNKNKSKDKNKTMNKNKIKPNKTKSEQQEQEQEQEIIINFNLFAIRGNFLRSQDGERRAKNSQISKRLAPLPIPPRQQRPQKRCGATQLSICTCILKYFYFLVFSDKNLK